jgi:hypothetical protein
VNAARLKYFQIPTQRVAASKVDTGMMASLFRACSKAADMFLEIDTDLSVHDAFCLTESVIRFTEAHIRRQMIRNFDAPKLPADIVLMNAVCRLRGQLPEDVILACKSAVPLLDRWDVRLADESNGEVLWHLYRQKLRVISGFISAGMVRQATELLFHIIRGEGILMQLLSARQQPRLWSEVGGLMVKCGKPLLAIDCFCQSLELDELHPATWVGLLSVWTHVDSSILNNVSDRLFSRMEVIVSAFEYSSDATSAWKGKDSASKEFGDVEDGSVEISDKDRRKRWMQNLERSAQSLVESSTSLDLYSLDRLADELQLVRNYLVLWSSFFNDSVGLGVSMGESLTGHSGRDAEIC